MPICKYARRKDFQALQAYIQVEKFLSCWWCRVGRRAQSSSSSKLMVLIPNCKNLAYCVWKRRDEYARKSKSRKSIVDVMLAPTIVKLLSEDKSFIAVMMNTRALTHRIDMISCSFARTTSLVTSYSLSLVLGTRWHCCQYLCRTNCWVKFGSWTAWDIICQQAKNKRSSDTLILLY
jgi:hypothetical protein